ncbi:MAG: AAA family ATPase, partial [Candidatus Methanomethylophilus sp.]|nr:AAA family ATPase [Methanomethylophilus sp.]
MTVEERRRPIPIGVDDFKTIRDEGYYFIDKSELISDILSDRAKVYLFTRPMRFGKSLNLSMLDAFFNVRYKGNTWFEGLKISDNEEAEGHKNTYPVIYINMKDIPVSEYNLFLSKIRAIVYDAYLEFLNLNECPDIPDALRRDYLETSPNGFDEIKLQGSIKVLCRMVNIAYGSKPIILIDEYDNPINNAFNKKDYDRIMEFLRNFYSSTFKSNEHLGFAVIIGV